MRGRECTGCVAVRGVMCVRHVVQGYHIVLHHCSCLHDNLLQDLFVAPFNRVKVEITMEDLYKEKIWRALCRIQDYALARGYSHNAVVRLG